MVQDGSRCRLCYAAKELNAYTKNPKQSEEKAPRKISGDIPPAITSRIVCEICGTELEDGAMCCEVCGFDHSCDAEVYPMLGESPVGHSKQWLRKKHIASRNGSADISKGLSSMGENLQQMQYRAEKLRMAVELMCSDITGMQKMLDELNRAEEDARNSAINQAGDDGLDDKAADLSGKYKQILADCKRMYKAGEIYDYLCRLNIGTPELKEAIRAADSLRRLEGKFGARGSDAYLRLESIFKVNK